MIQITINVNTIVVIINNKIINQVTLNVNLKSGSTNQHITQPHHTIFTEKQAIEPTFKIITF